MKTKNLKQISVVAVFSAIAFLLTFLFKFKVSFLTFDFKDAIIAIVSLTFGSVYGVASAAVVALLEFLSISDTGLYGLIMNFISSGTFALIFGSLYKYKRTFNGAIFSAVFSAIGVTTVMMLANYFITPYYMGVSRGDVLALIPTLLLPFNLAKTVINAAATLILYKPVTNALKRVGVLQGKNTEIQKFNKKSLILTVVSLLVIIVAILFVIFYLNGGFKFIAING
ncbi:MAG: ECF transporter S component [Clostridia bacterium]|nr:ECF transporter S component [Clostridia bacterium]